MSKFNQIQSELLSVDGARFQKLGDAYLHAKGYKNIVSRGSVIGKDKVRTGTPDTLIRLPNDRFILVEYTTQEKSLYGKLQGDINKCLDVDKTNIPLDKIEAIFLIYTGNLDADEDKLREYCNGYGCRLELFSIDCLSLDLYNEYPRIARDFLDVEIDSGQIVSASEFINDHDKNGLAATLDTKFLFRTDELEKAVDILEQEDVLAITGPAGVGKTRFALESMRRYVEHKPEWQFRCILSHNLPLYPDIRIYFGPPGNYIILCDDANRQQEVEHVLRLLKEDRLDRCVKLILTVRDYAWLEVKQLLHQYVTTTPIELRPLSDNEIRELVYKEFSIGVPHILNRIADVAGGNPRLAVMAAQVARKEDDLSTVANASSLYDVYYRSINNDINVLSKPIARKVAGIISFFQFVDRKDDALFREICDRFEIEQNSFWKSVQVLYDLEVVDIYENEVAKISDQILGTYLFYQVFFKEKLLDLSVLIAHFFFSHTAQTVDAINPLISVFGTSVIVDTLRPTLLPLWQEYAENEWKKWELMKVFWFVLPTETLIQLAAEIKALPSTSVSAEELSFELPRFNSNVPLLDLLGVFRALSLERVRPALDLVFRYAGKCAEDAAQVLQLLTNQFGFHDESAWRNYAVQHLVIDGLVENVPRQPEFYNHLFLRVAVAYLDTRFESNRFERGGVYTWHDFDLHDTPELTELRKKIWEKIFTLFDIPKYRQAVLDIVCEHAGREKVRSTSIIAKDAQLVLQFFTEKLDPAVYVHCLVVQEYLEKLRKLPVVFDESIGQRFLHPAYILRQLISCDHQQYMEMGEERYEFYKKQQLIEHTQVESTDDFMGFMERCREIFSSHHKDREVPRVQWAITTVLLSLADTSPQTYMQMLRLYAELENPLQVRLHPLVLKLIELFGPDTAYQQIVSIQSSNCDAWRFAFFATLPADVITKQHILDLRAWYENLNPAAVPRELTFVDKYLPLDRSLLMFITQNIYNKLDAEQAANILRYLFYPQLLHTIPNAFCKDITLLKKVYFLTCEYCDYADYNCEAFLRIMEADPSFPAELVDWAFQQLNDPGRIIEGRDWSTVWRTDDYKRTMRSIINQTLARVSDKNLLSYESTTRRAQMFLQAAFGYKRNNDKTTPDVEERIVTFLEELIEQEATNSLMMSVIFGVIGDGLPQHQLHLLKIFLHHNRNFDDFKPLDLEPSEQDSWQSEVDIYEEQIEFFNSILLLLADSDLLRHRLLIESRKDKLIELAKEQQRRQFLARG